MGEWESCMSLRFKKAIAETCRLRRLNFQDNLKSKIQNFKLIDGGPLLRLRCEVKAAKAQRGSRSPRRSKI